MKKILKNDYILSLGSKVFVMFFGFLSLILLNRYLGVELKGKYSTIINYITLISSILQLGISIVYPMFKRKKIDNCYEIFMSLSLIQFIIYILLSIIIIFFSDFNLDIIFICILSVFAIYTTQLRYINLVENIKYNAFIISLMSFLNFLFTFIVFVAFRRNIIWAYIIYLLKDLIIIISYIRKINLLNVFKINYIKEYFKILKAGFLPMLSGLLIIANYKIDIIMLDFYNIDLKLIGLYSLGLSISEYVWVIPDMFKDVVQKRTAKDNSIDTINFSLRMSSTLVCITYFVLLLLGKNLFGIIFGKEYVDAYKVTNLLFLGVYSMIFYKIIGQLFISDGKSKQYFIILLIGVLTNIVLNYVLIPQFNIIGASIASIVSYSVIGLIFLFLYMKQYKVSLKEVLIVKKSDIKSIKQLLIK